MGRPVKWARDLHLIRERTANSRTETWSRQDIERLFDVGRATAQTLMRAIGEVQNVAGTHFVDRISLLTFLNGMIAADSVEQGLKARLLAADDPPTVTPLRVALPRDLRSIMVRDLPENIHLSVGRLEILADSAASMLENLVILAQAMQNDLAHFERLIDPVPFKNGSVDEELKEMFSRLRSPLKHPEQ